MRSGRKHAARALGGAIALVALLVLSLTVYAAQQNWFRKGPQAQTEPVSADALTKGEDTKRDMDSLYRIWSLDFEDERGNAVSLDSLRGKPLALLYWASWCPDCVSEMPKAEGAALAAEAAGGRFQLVCRTGTRGETAETATDYLTNNGICLSTWLDVDASVYEALGLSGVPTVLYFSPEGMLMWADRSGDLSETRISAGLAYAAQGGLPATDAFVRAHLVDVDGRVAQSFFLTETGKIRPEDAALSEGQGLMMRYAVHTNDRALFDLVYGYARSALSEDGLFAWRIEGTKRADKDALLDDLRIIGALLDADDAFGGYAEEASEHADALKARAQGKLADWYALSGSARAGELSLAYADIATLDRLSALDEDWAAYAARAEEILAGGMLDTVPLYYPRYELATESYGGEEIHPAEAMVTLLHLAQTGELPERTRAFLNDWVRNGPVYARYALDGQPLDGYLYESTATYALMVLIGCELDDLRLIFPALSRMEKTRVVSGDARNGAYAHVGADNASFDTLCALLAWQAVTSGGYLELGG